MKSAEAGMRGNSLHFFVARLDIVQNPTAGMISRLSMEHVADLDSRISAQDAMLSTVKENNVSTLPTMQSATPSSLSINNNPATVSQSTTSFESCTSNNNQQLLNKTLSASATTAVPSGSTYSDIAMYYSLGGNSEAKESIDQCSTANTATAGETNNGRTLGPVRQCNSCGRDHTLGLNSSQETTPGEKSFCIDCWPVQLNRDTLSKMTNYLASRELKLYTDYLLKLKSEQVAQQHRRNLSSKAPRKFILADTNALVSDLCDIQQKLPEFISTACDEAAKATLALLHSNIAPDNIATNATKEATINATKEATINVTKEAFPANIHVEANFGL